MRKALAAETARGVEPDRVDPNPESSTYGAGGVASPELPFLSGRSDCAAAGGVRHHHRVGRCA